MQVWIWVRPVSPEIGDARVSPENLDSIQMILGENEHMRALEQIAKFCVLFSLFGMSVLSYGQIDRATIEGIVTDASGASVADARVTVTRVAANDKLELGTNDRGRYFAPNLPIGEYRVNVEKPGFRSAVSEVINLQAQASARFDFKLSVGQINETVQVSGEAPIVDASTATIASTLTAKQVDELPMIQIGEKRNIGAYLQFLPGVNNSSTWNPRVNGANGGNSEVFLDGAPASQGNVRGGVEETGPDVETVGEVSIVTNSFNAEYGRTGSWLMNVVTKSGTNQVHGSLYDNFANDALDTRSYFETVPTRIRQHDAGFTLGGPVYIPKVYDGRNKTFFFFGQELFYYRNQGSTSLATVPTAAFRKGDFSNFADSSGSVIPIFDPATTQPDGSGGFQRTQFSCNGVLNMICPNRISSTSQQMIALMLPPINSAQENNFLPLGGQVFDNRVTTIKVDHNLTPNHKISVTTTWQTRPDILPGNGWGVNSPLDGGQDPKNVTSYAVRLNYDYMIRSNLLNHLTIGGDGMHNTAYTNTIGQGWNQKLGITGLPADPGSFPSVNFSGGSASPISLGGGNDSRNISSRLSLNENLTWVLGRHTMKFGVNFIRERYANFEAGNSNGVFGFGNSETSQPDSPNFNNWGSSFASFLLGEVDNTSTSTISDLAWRQNYQAFFLQDEWRATPHLTVSYGIRWERYPGSYEIHDEATSFSPNVPNPAAGGILGALIFAGSGPGRTGRRTFANPWSGFAPRLGLVYEVTPKTVVRASGGVYYAPGITPRLDATGFSANPSFSSPDGFNPVYNWANTWPQNWNRPPQIDPSFANGQGVVAVLPNADRPPQIITWTLGVQRELAKDMALEISYIGSKSTHLELGGTPFGGPDLTSYLNVLDTRHLALGNLLNLSIDDPQAQAAGIQSPFPGFDLLPNHTVGQALRPYPQYTSVTMPYNPLGYANYNGLTIELTKRFSRGVSVLAFYTRSKAMTNDDAAATDLGEGPGLVQNPADPRHEYSVSMDDVPNRFGASFAYDLPFGPGKLFLKQGGVVGRIVGGWQIAGSIQRMSGQPLSIASPNANLNPFGFTVRANSVAGQPTLVHTGHFNPYTDLYLNPSAFTAPGPWTLGNTARTLDGTRGPIQATDLLSLQKQMQIHERLQVVLRADASNPFNIVRWNNPDTTLTDSTFGVISGSSEGRIMQLQLSIKF
jgi:hypothetical protein